MSAWNDDLKRAIPEVLISAECSSTEHWMDSYVPSGMPSRSTPYSTRNNERLPDSAPQLARIGCEGNLHVASSSKLHETYFRYEHWIVVPRVWNDPQDVTAGATAGSGQLGMMAAIVDSASQFSKAFP